MTPEFEARFLDIDPDALRAKLNTVGAKLIYPERLQRRVNMDYPDKRLALKEHGWIRLRDEGEGDITLTYKRRTNNSIEAALETTVGVADFDSAKLFLLSIGLAIKSEQETRRERWMLDGVEIDIDTWPWLPRCVEIEGRSEADVEKAASLLGFDIKKALFGPVNNAYRLRYDIPESETISYTPIFFNTPCPWKAK